MRLQNRVALVTGSAGAIGQAISRRLASEGASLALGYESNRGKAEQLAGELQRAGTRCIAIQADIRTSDSVRSMIRTVYDQLGQIDILVNNAGVLRNASIDDFTDEDWQFTFDVNVTGAVYCSREVAKMMGDQGHGAIVNIASRYAVIGAPLSIAYGASKAALVNITKALASYYAPRIRVNAVAPAYTLTPLTEAEPPAFLETFINQVPLRRAATPEDTAAAVAYLASDDAAFVTGHMLVVDGGYLIR